MISAAQALALVRIAFGLYLIMSALSKTQQGWFTNGGPLSQTLQQTLPRADPFYRAFLEGTVLPNVNLFAQLVPLGEWVAGISLLFGLLTRIGSLVGMWLMLNFMLMKGLANAAGSGDRLYFVLCLACLLGAAGLTWGVDGLLQRGFAGNPAARWLLGSPQAQPSLTGSRRVAATG